MADLSGLKDSGMDIDALPAEQQEALGKLDQSEVDALAAIRQEARRRHAGRGRLRDAGPRRRLRRLVAHDDSGAVAVRLRHPFFSKALDKLVSHH